MVSDVKLITNITLAGSQLLADKIPDEDAEIEKETIIKEEVIKKDIPKAVKDEELEEETQEEDQILFKKLAYGVGHSCKKKNFLFNELVGRVIFWI